MLAPLLAILFGLVIITIAVVATWRGWVDNKELDGGTAFHDDADGGDVF